MDAFVVPAFWGQVLPGVYRSQLPSSEHLAFVASMNFKSIVHLSPEVLERRLREFVDRSKITLYEIGLEQYDIASRASWKLVTVELVKQSIELVLDDANLPVLICGSTGVHITGVVVACLRKLMGWSLTSIMDEYRSFAGEDKAKVADELFIEFFDTDFVHVSAAKAPAWFLQHIEVLAEEEADVQVVRERKSASLSTADAGDALESRAGPVYLRCYYDVGAPIISDRVQYSAKKSLIDDEDD